MNPAEELKKHAVLSGFALLVILWLLVRGRKQIATVPLPAGDTTTDLPSVNLTYNVPPALNFVLNSTYPMLGDLSYNPSITFGTLGSSGASQSCGCGGSGGSGSNGFASIGDLISTMSNDALSAYSSNLQSLLSQYGG